ncbi:MAG: lytic transglycosylase domain-containing protein [Candidatus Acidoferrales bacterium]|nr:lytic transglycosylase domain-containing protein [Candidatus Acidoferrales bacterium]
MTRPAPALVLVLVAAAMLAPVARADYAVLRSGARLHVTGYELSGDRVRLAVTGGTVEIAASELIDVEPEDQFPAPPPVNADFGVRYANLIRASAQKHGVDEKLIAGVIGAESNFDPKAVSRKRALGLMQLLPETAARYAVANVFEPAQNIEAGTRYLKDLLARYKGNLTLALAAYNAGPETVDRYGGVPPFPETLNYIRNITAKLAQNANNSPTKSMARNAD